MAVGKRRQIHYRANEQVYSVINAAGQKMDVAFRVSNDGVAFRYVVENPPPMASLADFCRLSIRCQQSQIGPRYVITLSNQTEIARPALGHRKSARRWGPISRTDLTPVRTIHVRISFSMMDNRRSTPAWPCAASA